MATARPIYSPPFFDNVSMADISVQNSENISLPLPEFKPDDMFKSQDIVENRSEPERPRSPICEAPPSIFKPFPKDMCGNPMAYFPGGKMRNWQKK